MMKLIVAFRNFANADINVLSNVTQGRQVYALNWEGKAIGTYDCNHCVLVTVWSRVILGNLRPLT